MTHKINRLFIASFTSPESIDYTNKKELLEKHIKTPYPYAKIRFMKDDYLHLTWSFLGNTDAKIIPKIKEVIQESLNEIKQKHNIDKITFQFEFDHIGIINLYNRQGVYALMGKATNKESLDFFEVLNTKLSKLLGRQMNMDYKPHITLARVKFSDSKNLPDKKTKLPLNPTTLNFNEASLIESTLNPQGSIYKQLAKY